MKARMNYYPQFTEAFSKLNDVEGMLQNSTLDKHLIHLVKIRASQINNCHFCIDLHVKQARKDEEREMRLHHLSTWHESTLFTDKEKAALNWTEVLTKLSSNDVSDELYLATRQHFNEKEITELTMSVALINMWNRFGVSFKSVAGSMDKALGVENVKL
ncbi:carboxymuconolactone decarboxylase family protein [Bacteriovorax sp. PP10]|uniref:Carboxymuconolactone decarboxylase family protein n=1 Tax=Bacteriovorax antarcticus TaxID=3088717 RepID=A0ABU5VQ10_9BACT|nr:carboxymuconolactone decarboxylase family protein [Bacteriovorax sp. PP10]MEA9355138.1 carboxymuconolactone decarboxylase family protein [Bacteriovorax sp. PP10]